MLILVSISHVQMEFLVSELYLLDRSAHTWRIHE